MLEWGSPEHSAFHARSGSENAAEVYSQSSLLLCAIQLDLSVVDRFFREFTARFIINWRVFVQNARSNWCSAAM
ncbi:MAG: hypothetical protein CMK09_02710 [Ponticaulis sp.]|nr:hypothetical protein [Ponticaulis sp.]|tara:strand:- start:10878 stop:11099 length:222 start_codon:yes stop_codon:yes gene_type:complete